MPLPTESTPAPSLWTPLPLPKDLLIIQRLSSMTATRHGLQMSYLMIEEWITDAYCIMSLLNHIVPYVWQITARWSTGKAVRGYSLKSSSHMIKRHFDMRMVFHRPNKCTESQYVFSNEVQPGPIIEGCLRLDKAQEREEEKELAIKWCAWWAESQWCIRRDTACV